MYIKITTKCNMYCTHCCFASSPIGKHMPFEMFKVVMGKWGAQLYQTNNYIVIGGGEPTLHPDFWKIVNYSLEYGHPWICTNGKRTNDALRLAQLAKNGTLTAVLSLDKWHEPIEQCVISAFTIGMRKKKMPWGEEGVSKEKGDNRGIRTMAIFYKNGRGYSTGIDGCCCKQIQVQPTGIITMCGCDDAPVIGSVENGFFEQYKDIPWKGICHKTYNKPNINFPLLKAFINFLKG